MLLEIFTIFIPCWEVRKQQNLCQETLDSIARWESRQHSTAIGAKSLSSRSSSTWIGRSGKAGSVHTSSGSSVLTMNALEHTLAKNPEPLQQFSALRDFSGENIAFLTRINEWRTTYSVSRKDATAGEHKKKMTASPLSRACFESALRIYIDFVCTSAAEFQVNLSSQDFKNLRAVFEAAAQSICGERTSPDPATPFDVNALCPPSSETSADKLCYTGEIPEGFTDTVFDDAETSIKYLVLTNTWPKFVKERRSLDSTGNSWSGKTA